MNTFVFERLQGNMGGMSVVIAGLESGLILPPGSERDSWWLLKAAKFQKLTSRCAERNGTDIEHRPSGEGVGHQTDGLRDQEGPTGVVATLVSFSEQILWKEVAK